MTTTPCTVIDVTAGGTTCPRPATSRLTQGCIHEHTRQVEVCAIHAQRLLANQIVCRRCLESPLSHHCRVLARVAK